MKTLHFLVIGKHKEIVNTLKRIIENNEGWFAEITNSETFCYEYLEKHSPDILLLSSGLELAFENSIKEYIIKNQKRTKIIEHYGGGSGLLKGEVYEVFPELYS